MKIHIYTDIHALFGRGAMAWMDLLASEGHDVEYIDLGMSTDAPLPDVGPCDLNLMVAGVFAVQRFSARGLPRHGRHLFWLFDPLTRDGTSSHRYKAELFDALAPQVHAVACMDDALLGYFSTHFPHVPARRIPYLVAPASIAPPMDETGRSIDVLWLGSDNARRREAARLFEQAGVNADFHWTHTWGAARERLRRSSRIVLNIHADGQHTYFDQFRAFESWADGAVVVAEASGSNEELATLGITPGVHAAFAPFAELPALCRELLADAPCRQAMTRAAQQLLRTSFTPAHWRGEMLAMVALATLAKG